MSSDTDHPRQRTVAELLAEHGDAGATGRRRRRRASDESDEGGPDPRSVDASAGAPPAPPAERRSGPDRPGPRDQAPPPAYVPPEPRSTPEWSRPPQQPAVRERPTDVMPRIPAETPVVDETLTAPISTRPGQPQTRALAVPADDDGDEAGPSTMIGGAPAEAADWHRVRTERARRDDTAIDGGPPLPAGPVAADDEPAGLGPRPARVDLDKHEDTTAEAPKPRERRLGRASAAAKDAAAPAWAAVMVQWVAGALGGAVLWVLFRFLWRNLPVVALASAVLVTVGLVVIVRALLHNNDRRTTIFAVLVGLLLTVSPAILVLMGR